MKQSLEVSPELRVALDLEAHEKECDQIRISRRETKRSRQTLVETGSINHGVNDYSCWSRIIFTHEILGERNPNLGVRINGSSRGTRWNCPVQ